MTTQSHRLRQALYIAVLVGAASIAALADSSIMISGPKMALCYCHCDHAAECTKMCELPQYQSRWWAASCHKRNSAVKGPETPALNLPSRKTNRREQAS